MTWTEADRERLLCLLALRDGLIDRSVLEAALVDSSSLGGGCLIQSVVERSGLSRDVFTAIDVIAQTHIDSHQESSQEYLASLEDTIARALDTVDPAEKTSSTNDVQASAAVSDDSYATRGPVREDEADTETVARPSDGPAPAEAAIVWRDHRFERLRPHAKGGLGEVFLALDRQLNREVALKEIREQHADHLESRARFLQEAKITGGLEHPGIVPVYGLGHYPDGRPYYAMRFIKGDSLKEAIAAFHAADDGGRTESARGLELRQLLRRFLDVCNAIAYAHSKGVLHRDLKPGNVMLGPFGETLVVDWGLAKVQGVADQGEGSPSPLTVSRASGSSETLPGAAMGTPQFMSPEQARGDLENLGVATDVYSLGATLYALLTGRTAFEDKTLAVVLDKVTRGDFPPPRQVSRRVPAALDAICRKAMAREPEDRYAAVRDLAHDVEHWLADEPVAASPESRVQRSQRWMRRHRTWAQAIAATLILVTAVSVVATLFVGRERDEAQIARLNAIKEKVVAERSRIAETVAREKAEAAQKVVGEEKEKAVAKLYSASIGLAHQEWNVGNVARAEELLDGCPARLRGWEWRFLKGQCHADLMTLRGHASVANLIGFTPDGRQMVSSDTFGVLKVWDAATGRIIRSRRTNSVGIAFDRERRRMLAISNDPTSMLIWDTASEAQPKKLVAPDIRTGVGAFSPDGHRLALAVAPVTIRGATRIRLWDLDKGTEITQLAGRADPVVHVAFSPDGKLLAVARRFGWIEVWELEGNKKRLEFRGHPGEGVEISRVAFSHDGKSLVSAGLDGIAKVWDAADGHQIVALPGQSGFLYSAAFSPDGRRIATANSNRTVRIWDVASGREQATLRGHTSEVNDVAWSPDGTRLLSTSHDATLKLWDVRDGSTEEFPTVVAPSDDKSTSPPVASVRTLGGHVGAVSAMAFRHDSRRLATVGWDGQLRIHDLATSRAITTVKILGERELAMHLRVLTGGTRLPTSLGAVAYSPDGSRIAVGTESILSPVAGIVRIVDAESGAVLRTIRDLKGPVSTLSYSRDGRRLLVATGGLSQRFSRTKPTVAIYDAETDKTIVTFYGHDMCVFDGAFSPDGRTVATTGEESAIRIWDAETGAERLTLGKPGNSLDIFRGVAWSPDGKTLAAAGQDFGVRLFDTETGAEIRKLRGHSSLVYRVAFSHDGKRLASTGRDSTVRLWDVVTGDELLTFRDHSSEVYDLAFSPDGQTLASTGFDGKISLRTANYQELPRTDSWEVVFSDDFERGEIGDRWQIQSGQWTIEKGAARGVLATATEVGDSRVWATLVPRGLYLPSNTEIRFEVWSPNALNFEAKLHDTPDHKALEGLCAVFGGSASERYTGEMATSILIAASGAYSNVLSNPHFTLPPGVHLKVRILRETRRFTVWIGDEEVVSAPVPEMIVPILHLQAGYGRAGDVVYLDNIQVRTPRESATERNALTRLAELIDREPLLPDALAKLKADTTLDPATKDLALALGGRREQGPEQLNRMAYPVVIDSARTPDEYQLALKRLEEANRLAPDNPMTVLDSLGVAQYRVGRYAEALDNLARADKGTKLEIGTSFPTNLAFQAMAQFRLGHRPEAVELLEEIGLLAMQPIWTNVSASAALRDEAEALTGSSIATNRERTIRNLQMIGRGFHQFHEKHNRFPLPAILAPDGRQLLSWRVALLPYVGGKALYDRFHLDEPWDGPHNKLLLAEIPDVYSPRKSKTNEQGLTSLRVFTGPSTVFPGKVGMAILDIRDGTNGTILAVESTEEVPWTKPDELPFAADRPLPSLGSIETKRASLLFCDGSVITTRPVPSAEALLKAIVTPNGSEPVNRDRLPR